MEDKAIVSMSREQLISHIFAFADSISDIVDNYDEDNINLFATVPDQILHKMASVLNEAHRHLDQNLGIYQPEFDKIKQDGYDDE